MSELMLDVGQANELKIAFRREGAWTNEEIKILCERKGFLTQVHEALLGRLEIKPVDYLFDFDADPLLPSGWKVEEHQKGGKCKHDSLKVGLYLSRKQKKGIIGGNVLRLELKNQPVYNVNLLDFYLKNKHLIPEDWKGKFVFFWGTIYRNADGNLYVRYLYWDFNQWYWHYRRLGNVWNVNDPTAVSGK